MPPNAVEVVDVDPEMVIKNARPAGLVDSEKSDDSQYASQICLASLNLLTHILIGITVGICLLFSFRNGLPLNATNLHIVLCVVGYQLLMAEAILALAPENGWSAKLRLVHKRRAHWILQILGSGLAIAGSFIKILDKEINWNSLHGQFGLVALVFTSVSLVNGLASLYAYELRKIVPGTLSRLSHICFGTVAFAASSICLCYGFDKNLFRSWASSEFTITLIIFVAIFTFITIVSPLLTFGRKSLNAIKK